MTKPEPSDPTNGDLNILTQKKQKKTFLNVTF